MCVWITTVQAKVCLWMAHLRRLQVSDLCLNVLSNHLQICKIILYHSSIFLASEKLAVNNCKTALWLCVKSRTGYHPIERTLYCVFASVESAATLIKFNVCVKFIIISRFVLFNVFIIVFISYCFNCLYIALKIDWIISIYLFC